jgi:hypothetical protein
MFRTCLVAALSIAAACSVAYAQSVQFEGNRAVAQSTTKEAACEAASAAAKSKFPGRSTTSCQCTVVTTSAWSCFVNAY